MSKSIVEEIGTPVGVHFKSSERNGRWRVWCLLVLPPVLLMLLSIVVGAIGVIAAEGDRSVISPTIGRWTPYILMANHSVLFLILLRFMHLDGMSMRDIGWSRSKSDTRGILVEIGIGLVSGVIFYLLHQYVWGALVTWMSEGLPDFRTTSSTTPIGSNTFLAVSVGIVLGGFVEEQIYRGYVLTRLTEKMSLPISMTAMLFFFMLLHFGLGWTGMLVAGLTGLLLSLLFVWRRSLYSVITAHGLINTLVLLL